MATPGVLDIDLGMKRIVAELSRVPDVTISLGVQGSEADQPAGGGLNMASLALLHEFGAPAANIVERSVLRATIERERVKYEKLFERAARRFIDGADIRREMELIALITVSDVRRTFDQSIGLAPLKEATIAAKGSTKPLIDTARLKAAYTAIVE